MKRNYFVIGMIILTMLLAACQSDSAVTDESASDEGPITIGISLLLSDRFSDPGSDAQNGYEVWAKLVNDSGGILGRDVELIILDNESDQDTAAAQYEKLITEDEVDLVAGTFSSLLVIPTSEVAAKHGYAYVEPAGGAPDVFNRNLTNLFFAQPAPSARQADPFALYVLSLPVETRPQTFAVVSQDDPFALSVMERLSSLLTDGGLELVLNETYSPEQTDFSEIATTVADLDPDLILGGTQTEDSIGQIQAYQAVNYQPRMAYFTSGPSVAGPFRAALGASTEGVFSSISWFPEGNDYQNSDFVNAYVDMFGGSLGDIAEDAANAFTVGQVLQQAVENVGSVDNASLIEELHRSTYDTIVGSLSFDGTGAPEGSYMLLQWQGDNFVIVGPADRAEVNPLADSKPEW